MDWLRRLLARREERKAGRRYEAMLQDARARLRERAALERLLAMTTPGDYKPGDMQPGDTSRMSVEAMIRNSVAYRNGRR